LVLALFVDVMEVSEHLDGRDVGTSVVDDTLGSILDEVLEELESLWREKMEMTINLSGDDDGSRRQEGRRTDLVDLSPFSGFLLHEALVDSGHDLVELLAVRVERMQEAGRLSAKGEDEGRGGAAEGERAERRRTS
jgi:hypothetical protein